ncbi:hypothetical protein ABIA32_000871 [Streptacidiphilus sp. MAP12-20]|uniref:hypothetical protein n=1 Tax=Streptacidiphilus sp. MAP12-20 TaxID=3156299 RepID=UPI00351278E5
MTIFFLNDNRALLVAPNHWGHVSVRITFGGTANLGTWHIRPYIEMDELLNKLGGFDGNYLTEPRPMYNARLTV